MASKAKASSKSGAKKGVRTDSSHRFEPVKLDALFTVLDALAWLENPSIGDVAQFAGIDPRTAGKHLKNACQIGLADKVGSGYPNLLHSASKQILASLMRRGTRPKTSEAQKSFEAKLMMTPQLTVLVLMRIRIARRCRRERVQ